MIERALDDLKYDLDMKERSSSKPARFVRPKTIYTKRAYIPFGGKHNG